MLTKTEAKLLKRFQSDSIAIEWCGSYAKNSGKFRGEGRREFAAAEKLIQKGLLIEIRRDHCSWISANGTRCRSTVILCKKAY